MKALLNIKSALAASALAIVAVSLQGCATKRSATDGTAVSGKNTAASKSAEALSTRKLTFVQKVADNAVYAKNITAKIDFTLKTGDKDITVDGSLRMRKDEVIRIQLSPFGLVEVGRVELTPDYVLIIDRIHKEYIKGSYDQVPFLQRNGLDFYTLQALFWNKLFLPGEQSVSENSLRKYDAGIDEMGENTPVRLTQGNLQFTWNANKLSGRIASAVITYASKSTGTSSVSWKYDNFKALGAKNYPTTHTLTLSSTSLKKGNGASVTIKMSNLGTKSDWNAKTEVPGKYKEVSAEEVLKKIMSL